MYAKPKLEVYGTFRELTRTGVGGGGDGCIVLDPTTGAVVDGNPADGTFGTFAGVVLPSCAVHS